MECTDENIISLIQQLDRKSEYQGISCLKKCEPKTYGVLLRMNLQEADERQSIFFHSMAEFIIQVRQKRFILTGEAKICTYLTEIARRKWLNESKKNKRLNNLPEDLLTASTIEEENDSNDRIKKALQQLEESDRDILVMFYFYNTDLEEYSKQQGVSYAAAKKRISRARTRLKNILKPIQH